MSATTDSFIRLMDARGADILYHRETGGTLCPCLTPEGFRDPEWHRAHPDAPVCNSDGMLAVVSEAVVKGIIQAAYYGGSGRARTNQALLETFGDIEVDDRIGIFPVTSGGITIDFTNWSKSGADWVELNGNRYIAIAWADIPAPDSLGERHHWEVSLRRVNKDVFK